MDDKTRRVGRQREELTGRGDERQRNLDSQQGGAAAPSTAPTPTVGGTRRGTAGARRTSSSPSAPAEQTRSASAGSAADDGLDRQTDERTRELQAEIADTREELSETIEAIQERLRPGTIVSNAADRVKEKARGRVRDFTDQAGERATGMMRNSRRTAGDVVENVKHNPVPALMIGAGVAWLLMDRAKHENGRSRQGRQREWSSHGTSGGRGYNEYGAGYRANYVEAGSGFDFDDDEADYSDIDYRRPQGTGLTENVSDRASSMMGGARDRWQRTTRTTTNGLQRLMRDNPLLVGAAAVLVGAAVGAALPETERENDLMGETRDSIVNQAQEMAQNAASTAKEAASNLPAQVTEAVASQVTGSDRSRA